MNALTLHADRTTVPTDSVTERHLLATVTAPMVPRAQGRPPADVVFVVDRSGSMRGQAMHLAREAVLQGVGLLSAQDRFAVVAYDNQIDVVQPLTHPTPALREQLPRTLDGIDARGSTDLAGGWLTGCQLLAEGARPGALRRVLLLSDGHANQGITDHAELRTHASELSRRGITTSTFGLGDSFDELLMTAIASAGGGNAYFVQQASKLSDLLTSELGDALVIAATGVSLQFTLPEGATLTMLSEFDCAESAGVTTVSLGTVVSSQVLPVLCAVTLPAKAEGTSLAITCTLQDDGQALGGPSAALTWQVVTAAAAAAEPVHPAVVDTIRRVRAAKAKAEAVELNRRRDFEQAHRRIQQERDWFVRYEGQDSATASALEGAAVEFAQVMSPDMMKGYMFASRSVRRHRSMSGKSMRFHVHETLRVSWVRDVPVLHIGTARVLFDTGVPTSFGVLPESAGPALATLLGDPTVRLPKSYASVTPAQISAHLGAPIDAVLGTDLIARAYWLLEPDRGRAVVSLDPLQVDGPTMMAPLTMGVPTMRVRVGGRDGLAFIDTGAGVSYMDGALAATYPVVDTVHDFFPLIGEFDTDVRMVEAEFSGLRFRGRFGVLPPLLETALSMAGAQWILGAELLRQVPLVFRLGQGIIQVATDTSALDVP